MQGGMNPYLHNVRTANTGKEATITVQGEGVIKAKPNVVVLTIGIRTDNKDVKQAQEENAIQSKQLLAALKQIGIADKDIET
ncbi:SIMPL domain-containing protein, partial [Klebsiella pneumoniae]|uniref:SIMPL domain-containing protein n=1 Tax=Klebsiella pneumoniae TaxID=573 RepID=UPI000E2F515D